MNLKIGQHEVAVHARCQLARCTKTLVRQSGHLEHARAGKIAWDHEFIGNVLGVFSFGGLEDNRVFGFFFQFPFTGQLDFVEGDVLPFHVEGCLQQSLGFGRPLVHPLMNPGLGILDRLFGPLHRRELLWGCCCQRRSEFHRGVSDHAFADSALADVVEVTVELVELALRDGIVFVVVTTRASKRQTKPNGSGCFHAIDHVLDQELFCQRAAFAVLAVVPIERGGESLLVRRVGEHVTGKLFDRELIERHVVVERLNDPVTPGPIAAFGVVLIAVGVGIASGVHPQQCLTFGIVPSRHQFIDCLFEGLFTWIGQVSVLQIRAG